MGESSISELDIAIIGLAGRFPSAGSVGEFWDYVRTGREAVEFLSEEDLRAAGVPPTIYRDPRYVPAVSRMPDPDRFDAGLFDYSPREAELMDPQSRVFLECAWEALEVAGYDPVGHGARIGLYAGQSIGTYLMYNLRHTMDSQEFLLTNPNIRTILGNNPDFLTTRVAYKLGLSGPVVSVATACSTSLVAIHMARQSLLMGECEMALAGAASIYLPQDVGYLYQEGSLLSPDGHCRVFDARASGTIFGRGAAVAVLKPLVDAVRDRDPILAVIKGSAVTNDGGSRAGFTAPGVSGQARAIAEALSVADVHPDTIGYVEAHGTGTRQGDPIEVAGLTQAYRLSTDRSGYCAIGSVKSNVGHLDAAAGMAGLTKTVMMLQDGVIAPSLNFEEPNPEIDFGSTPFFVNTTLRAWERGRTPRRAGVSSFGLGGTNAHLVLEEAPPAPTPSEEHWPVQIVAVSGKTARALDAQMDRYSAFLPGIESGTEPDVAFTSQVGRAALGHRVALVGRNRGELGEAADHLLAGEPTASVAEGVVPRNSSDRPGVAFLSTGQGAQFPGMGRELYETLPTFREAMDLCLEAVEGVHDPALRDVLYPDAGREAWAREHLTEALHAQPALFALEFALATVWRSWGVEPDLVMGHSAGEYVSATLAGVFGPQDGMRIVAERGRLMQESEPGEMVVVRAGEAEVADLVERALARGERVAIAAVNGPENVVVSGEGTSVRALATALETRGREVTRLMIRLGAHSPLMESMLPAYREFLRGVTFHPPRTRVVSNVTGDEISSELAHPEYWIRHTREPVRFARGIARARELGCGVFIEIGPRPVLLGMANASLPHESPALWLPSLRPDYGDWRQMMESLAAFWASGGEVDWEALHEGHRRRRHVLPTYAFQRERHWIDEAQASAGIPAAVSGQESVHPLLGTLGDAAVTLFESRIRLQDLPFLEDHRLTGRAVLPGTAYLELGLAAAKAVEAMSNPEGDGSGTALEDVMMEQPLLIDDGTGTRIQTILQPDGSDSDGSRSRGAHRFEVFSPAGIGSRGPGGRGRMDSREGRPDEASRWVRHASGRIVPMRSTPDPGGRTDPPAGRSPRDVESGATRLRGARDRCVKAISTSDFYEAVARTGIELGPAFRGLTEIWQGEHEALGAIDVPETLTMDDFLLHPAVLDAAVQSTIAAAEPEALDFAYLPMSVDRLEWRRSPAGETRRLWSHVEMDPARARGETLVASVELFTRDGVSIARIEGLRLRRVDARDLRLGRDPGFTYQVEWQILGSRGGPVSTDSAASGAEEEGGSIATDRIARDLCAQMGEFRERHGLGAYADLKPHLDALCALFAIDALGELADRASWMPVAGQTFESKELGTTLGVRGQHSEMFARLVEMVAEEGMLEWAGREFEAKEAFVEAIRARAGSGARAALRDSEVLAEELERSFPHAATEISLVSRCGPELASVLVGERDPLELLFPGGSMDDLEALYRDAGFTRAYNEIVRDVVRAVVASTGSARPLRILEVGAGTGGTAAWVLPELPAERSRYVFSDVSAAFLSRAGGVLAEYPFVEYQLFDLERPASEQGLPPGGFDLVLATQVVHATDDLRRSVGNLRSLLAPGGAVVLVEGVGPQRWVDLVFGLTEGWWRFTDRDLRPRHPLLGAAAWTELLESAGFEDVETLPGTGAPDDLFGQTVLLARRALETGRAPSRGAWLVWSDGDGVGSEVVPGIEAAGAECTIVRPGSSFERIGPHEFRVDPSDRTQLERVVTGEGVDPSTWEGVLYLWPAAVPVEAPLSSERLVEDIRRGVEPALHLIQALVAGGSDCPPRVWLVTEGAQSAGRDDRLHDPAQAMLWGFGRTVAREHPELRCTLVDLPRSEPVGVSADDVDALVGLLVEGGEEDQLAIRSGSIRVPRLTRTRPLGDVKEEDESRLGSAEAVEDGSSGVFDRLVVTEPGSVENLAWTERVSAPPGPGEVAIRVESAGLNFRDVLSVLGLYPGDPGPLGRECVGTIVATGPGVEERSIGDRVVALAPGALSTRVTAEATATIPLPSGMDEFEGATLLGAYLTAYYALDRLAAVQSGETVLVHAAAGGVGSAAVRIALARGAKVFATAGRPEKREFLERMGLERVMDSRSVDFSDEILASTDGRGVDVVLNTLAGETVPASFAALRRDGRFIELGKLDVWDSETVERTRPDVRFHQFDLDAVCAADPGLRRTLLDELAEAFESGSLEALPHQVFSSSEVDAAFRHMRRAHHIGKVVVCFPRNSRGAGHRVPVREDGSYLITGGLGGLGLLTARWLAERGAGGLVLMGRSDPTGPVLEEIDAIRALGVTVVVEKGDVSDREAVVHALSRGGEIGRLRGVIHAAGTLDDGTVAQQTWDRFRTVMAAKVEGTWNLHRATVDGSLDFLLLFSSAASLLGPRGQGNHAAVSAFEDAFAQHRAALGLPTLAIDWGAWGEVGAAVDRDVLRRMAAGGIGTLASSDGLDALGQCFDGRLPWPQVAVMPMDWERFVESEVRAGAPVARLFAEFRAEVEARAEPQGAGGSGAPPSRRTGSVAREIAEATGGRARELLEAYVRRCSARTLGLDPSGVDPEQPLSELGLDSLMAVELRSVIAHGLDLPGALPATLLFDYPTVHAVTEFLARRTGLDESPDGAAEPTEVPDRDRALFDEVAEMTDEEAEAALLADLGIEADSQSEEGSGNAD